MHVPNRIVSELSRALKPGTVRGVLGILRRPFHIASRIAIPIFCDSVSRTIIHFNVENVLTDENFCMTRIPSFIALFVCESWISVEVVSRRFRFGELVVQEATAVSSHRPGASFQPRAVRSSCSQLTSPCDRTSSRSSSSAGGRGPRRTLTERRRETGVACSTELEASRAGLRCPHHADFTPFSRLFWTHMRTVMPSVISLKIFPQVAVDSYRRR